MQGPHCKVCGKSHWSHQGHRFDAGAERGGLVPELPAALPGGRDGPGGHGGISAGMGTGVEAGGGAAQSDAVLSGVVGGGANAAGVSGAEVVKRRGRRARGEFVGPDGKFDKGAYQAWYMRQRRKKANE